MTKISLTAVPTDRPPFPLPEGVNVPVFFTAQPGGSIVIPPRARIIYPNLTNEPAGSRINFWNYDPTEKGWYVYGQGTVTDDRKQIVPDSGVVIYEFSGIMISTASRPPGPPCDCSAWDGDPVHLGTGLFVMNQTDLVLPDIIPISLTRIYRQNDPKWRPFGTGTRHPYEMFLVGDQTAYSWADLVLPDGGKVRFNRYSSGTGPTGAMMEAASTPTAFYKATLIYYGVSYDGRWDLRMKDGSVYRFSVDGREVAPLSAIIDRNGNQLSVVRYPDPGTGTTGDLQGHRIKRIVSPNGRWVEFTYDASFHITEAKDNIGRVVGYEYDASGRLWKVTDAMGGVTEYSYDAANRMKTMKNARGIVHVTIDYDVNGRVMKETLVDGGIYQFAYTLDTNGKVTQTDVTDPRGQVRRVTFNSDGYSLTDTLAVGTALQQTMTYERQSGSNKTLNKTDPLNRRTNYAYDSTGNVTTITRLAGTSEAVAISYTYEPNFNQLTSVTDPLNHTTTFGYDSIGNFISLTNHLGHQGTFAYNSAGQVVSETDPLLHTRQFSYDQGDLVSTTDALGRIDKRFVDSAGRTLSETDTIGRTARYEYDALDRLTKITDSQGGVTLFAYDANSNLLSITDPRGKITSYTYDNMDRLIIRTDPLLRVESFEYDLMGNLTKATDRRGKVTSLSYDSLDRLVFIGYGTVTSGSTTYESTTSFVYEGASCGCGGADRLTQVIDSVSGTINYTYDNLDRLTSETTPQGAISYSYDAAGRQTSMTVAGQPTINYTFDNVDRLTQISQGSSTVSFAYDLDGRETSMTLPNGVITEYGYDAASQLTSLIYKKGANVLGNLTYEYDAAGQTTKIGGSFARMNLPQAVSTTSYDSANQMTAFGAQTLTYDNNGNLTSDGVNTYTWDARNQLGSISGPGMNASFQYDALGRRVSKTINSATTEFLYDGANIVQEKTGGAISANIVSGRIDEFFTRADASGSWSPIVDGLGSVLALTDASGNAQTEYTYEPFGKTAVSGTANSNAQKYTGREDDGTGLYYYRARYYMPTLQRFISEDPVEFAGGINSYAYVDNNPLRFIDPFGLTGEMELPSDPSKLGPKWTHDPTHKNPNGSRWRGPGGDYLDFHKGREGAKGWRGKDHWHHNGDKKHLRPGDKIPIPDVCEEPEPKPTPKPKPGPTVEEMRLLEESYRAKARAWEAVVDWLPGLIPGVGPVVPVSKGARKGIQRVWPWFRRLVPAFP